MPMSFPLMTCESVSISIANPKSIYLIISLPSTDLIKMLSCKQQGYDNKTQVEWTERQRKKLAPS